MNANKINVEALIPFQEIPELKEKLKALGETRAREKSETLRNGRP